MEIDLWSAYDHNWTSWVKKKFNSLLSHNNLLILQNRGMYVYV